MSEIAVLVGNATQWRFVPHGPIRADEVITPRHVQYPPIPVGATLLWDGEPLGTVRCVRREPFSRWAVVFNPVDGGEKVDGSRQTVDGVGDVEITVTIPEDVPEGAVVDLHLDEGGEIVVTVGTPIAALEPHLDPRMFGTVAQLAQTVEELAEKTDETLRAIDGIGPKRLREIRAACDAALTGAE